jgi:drug/metabolite transporter (DMT)-like permease
VSFRVTNKKAFAAVVIVSFFWGTTYLVARVTVQHIPGLFLAGIRNLLAGTAILLFFLLKGYPFPDKKTILQSALIGFVMVSFSSGLSTWSVQYISGGLAAIIGATIPLWIALFSMIVNKKRKFSFPVLIGLLMGFAGIAIIFYDHLTEMLNSSFRKGILLASISCITWAAGSVYASEIKLKTNILLGAGLQMLFAGIFLTIVCTLMGQTTDLYKMPRETWMGLFYLVIIGSVLTYSSYVYAINHLPPARVGVYAYINPIVAILLGNILLNERLSFVIALGAMVTITGVYLVNSNLKKLSIPPEEKR